MKHTSAQLKQMARANLGNKWRTAIGITAIHTLMIYALTTCTLLFQSTTTMGIVVQLVVRLIISLLTGLFTAGSYYFYLNICRGRQYGISDLFAAFKMNPDRFLIVSLIIELPLLLFELPALTAGNITTFADALHLSMRTSGYSILAYGISIIFSMFFELSYFLMLDFPEMEAMSAMKISASLMKENKLRYLYIMVLSFVGWRILALFSLSLGYFWITPYITMTMTYFYCDVLEQLKHSQYMQDYDVPEFHIPDEDGNVLLAETLKNETENVPTYKTTYTTQITDDSDSSDKTENP